MVVADALRHYKIFFIPTICVCMACSHIWQNNRKRKIQTKRICVCCPSSNIALPIALYFTSLLHFVVGITYTFFIRQMWGYGANCANCRII